MGFVVLSVSRAEVPSRDPKQMKVLLHVTEQGKASIYDHTL